jgi:hypothetical protein
MFRNLPESTEGNHENSKVMYIMYFQSTRNSIIILFFIIGMVPIIKKIGLLLSCVLTENTLYT